MNIQEMIYRLEHRDARSHLQLLVEKTIDEGARASAALYLKIKYFLRKSVKRSKIKTLRKMLVIIYTRHVEEAYSIAGQRTFLRKIGAAY